VNRPVWDDDSWSPLPSLSGNVTADLCVIGLGASGLCAVLEGLSFGRRVVGIDATVTAGGAAGANGGILRAGISHSYHEAVARLGRQRAHEFYRLTAVEINRIEQETPSAVRRCGSMRVTANEREWEDAHQLMAAMRGDGIECEVRETPLGRGIFVPHDAAMQPITRGRALARMAIAQRAKLHENTRALSWTGGEVRTPNGRITCDGVVIAVDGGLEDVVPALRGLVRTTRLQMLATEPATDVTIPWTVSMSGGWDYCQQLPDGRIALGGGRNRSFDTEWGAPAAPSEAIQSYLDSVLRDRLKTKAKVTHRWGARVGYTEDGLPVLAEVAPRVWAAGAYSGTGNLLGALYGRAAARLACGELSRVPEIFKRVSIA
jgi:glycine/D-amino acid oxidase-like deaminating enzyme